MTVAKAVEFWGPSAWKFLHAITFSMSDTPDDGEIQHLLAFFNHVGHLLPCPACGTHYLHYMEEHRQSFEDAVNSGPKLRRFVYDLHAEVVTRTGGPPSPSFAEVEHMYRFGHLIGTPPPSSLGAYADPHFGTRSAPQESPLHYVALAVATAVLLREGAHLWAGASKKKIQLSAQKTPNAVSTD